MKGINVGFGNRGKAWHRWAKAAGVDVVGVVDLNREILDRNCDELEIPEPMRFTSIEEAVASTDAEVATVCTANPHHNAAIQSGLDAGLHVIVEKPMVETAKDANEIIKKAEGKGLQVACSQNGRFHPGVLTLRNAIENGEIGELLSASVTFHRWRPTEGLFLPLMLNQSIHHLDGLRWILQDDPAWCFARSFNPDWNKCDGPTVIEAIYGFSKGTMVTYSGSYVAQGTVTPYSGIWRIEGSTGQMHFQGDGDEAVTLTRRDPKESRTLPAIKTELASPAQVCRDFLDAIRNGTPAPTAAQDNVKSLAMAWAAQKSSDENRVVQIDEAI